VKILGLSCYYHDSAACVIDNGEIVAAAQEERFSRIKHDQNFPSAAVRYCLAEADVSPDGLDAIAFYDKPILKFHRILETYFSTAPSGLTPFVRALPLWLREKLWIEPDIQSALKGIGIDAPQKIYFPEHHESHAASAFYPSPFEEAAILTVDGVGEWATSTIGVGEGSELRLTEQISFPHSLGLLYSAFTYFAGFKVNSAEYKVMGLAPYGEGVYTQKILNELMDLKEDGSFRLNMDYFGYLDDLVMTTAKMEEIFGGPPRTPESPITQREMNIARSIQDVTEEIVLRMAKHARTVTGKKNLCMAGGVALNCVANGKLLRQGIFEDIWIQPAAGDAGGAIGAALAVWHGTLGNSRTADGIHDRMRGSYLGPEFTPEQIKQYLDAENCSYIEIQRDDDWAAEVAKLIADQKVIGLFQGRMEFGPRALGNRSIVGDARSTAMQSLMNRKIKYREDFRPFAPSCLEERVSEYFELDRASPYMLLVAPIRPNRRIANDDSDVPTDLDEWINQPRSDLPAITHVDYSARVQSVSTQTNARYHKLIEAFEKLTGVAAIINTSFNVRGEPIVCTPEDAYRCFMRTEMDYLSLGPFLLSKADQPSWKNDRGWADSLPLD